MNSSFVRFVYTVHFSSLNIIIILGTEQTETMIEEMCFMRICDMLKLKREKKTSGIGICVFTSQITSVYSSFLSILQILECLLLQVHLEKM